MTKFIQENLFQQYNDQQLKYRMYVHLIVPIAGFATHFPAFDRGITNVTRMQHTRYRKMQKLLTTNICTLFKLDFWISWNFQWHEKKERKTHKVVKKQEKISTVVSAENHACHVRDQIVWFYPADMEMPHLHWLTKELCKRHFWWEQQAS